MKNLARSAVRVAASAALPTNAAPLIKSCEALTSPLKRTRTFGWAWLDPFSSTTRRSSKRMPYGFWDPSVGPVLYSTKRPVAVIRPKIVPARSVVCGVLPRSLAAPLTVRGRIVARTRPSLTKRMGRVASASVCVWTPIGIVGFPQCHPRIDKSG